jgi:hypothetical protein
MFFQEFLEETGKPPAEPMAMLESIREETRRTLRSALGATAYEAYARDGGDWVDTLSEGAP